MSLIHEVSEDPHVVTESNKLKKTLKVHSVWIYSKTCLKQPLSKRPKTSFQDQLLLNAGQKYCRMLPLEHSAIRLTFIKLPFVITIFVFLFLSGRFRQVLLYMKFLCQSL